MDAEDGESAHNQTTPGTSKVITSVYITIETVISSKDEGSENNNNSSGIFTTNSFMSIYYFIQ